MIIHILSDTAQWNFGFFIPDTFYWVYRLTFGLFTFGWTKPSIFQLPDGFYRLGCFMSSLTLSSLETFCVFVNDLFAIIYDLLLLHNISTVNLCILHILVHVAQLSGSCVVHYVQSQGIWRKLLFFRLNRRNSNAKPSKSA